MSGESKRQVYNRYLPLKVKQRTYEELRKIANLRGEDVSKVVRTAIRAEIEYAPELENEHK